MSQRQDCCDTIKHYQPRIWARALNHRPCPARAWAISSGRNGLPGNSIGCRPQHKRSAADHALLRAGHAARIALRRGGRRALRKIDFARQAASNRARPPDPRLYDIGRSEPPVLPARRPSTVWIYLGVALQQVHLDPFANSPPPANLAVRRRAHPSEHPTKQKELPRSFTAGGQVRQRPVLGRS